MIFPILGFYCATDGLPNVTDSCSAGYYCPNGSEVATENKCPVGFHCPVGSATPQPCKSGFYTNSTEASVCLSCPAGFYCTPLVWSTNITLTDSISYHACPRGYYCPIETGSNWKKCPAGKYSNETGLSDVLQCQDCPPGHFCDGILLTQPKNMCDEGFYCKIGEFTIFVVCPLHKEG